MFEAVSLKSDDGNFLLKEIRTGADVLATVQSFMGLAVGGDTLASTLKQQVKQQNKKPAPDSIYSSVQLYDVTSQIRLIELLPGEEQDDIRINLTITDDMSSQPYEAISYVWGIRDNDVTIFVNSQPFEVPVNLAQALRCLRPIDGSRVLWADAICINQVDDIEKSQQVSLMGEIYRRAEEVIIFLGEEKDDSAMVMQYLNIDDIEGTESQFPALDIGDGSKRKIEKVDDRRLVEARIQLCGFDSTRFLRAADAFFKRPWWNRMWVLQEYMLATRDPRWYCGRLSTSTSRVHDRVEKLYMHLISEAAPISGTSSVSTDSQVDVESEFGMMFERKWNMSLKLMDRKGLLLEQRPFQAMVRNLRRQSTDPRDRVFAAREMLDTISKQVFVPNYAAAVDKVFVMLATFILALDNQGHIYDLYELAYSQSMPSWIPDFTKPHSQQANSALTTQYMAIRGAKDVEHLSVYNRALGISGVELDTLDAAECFDNVSDIEILGRFWRLEGLVQRSSPLEDLPEEARPYVPSHCVVPLSGLGEDLEKAGNELLKAQLPMTPSIPGYSHIATDATRRMLDISSQSLDVLKCETWERAVYPFAVLTNIVKASVYWSGPESFIGGSYFDLDNLKKQIMSVPFPQEKLKNPSVSSNPEEVGVAKEEARRLLHTGQYCPQYSYMKDILRHTRNETRFENLKKWTCKLADHYHDIVAEYVDKRGASSIEMRAELQKELRELLAKIESRLRELSENCTCEGDKKDKHREMLDRTIRNTQAEGEKILEKAGTFIPDTYELVPKLFMTMKKQYKGFFISRFGFFGVIFQRQSQLKKGDKIAVLDGIPAPIILEETGDGSTYRMKAAAEVVGIKDVDVAKLVELGVCKRKDCRIV